jgi:hypothetical protein
MCYESVNDGCAVGVEGALGPDDDDDDDDIFNVNWRPKGH